MKFTVSRENILLPLQKVVAVIEKKQTQPILSNALLTVDGDQLTLTGSDLEIELVTQTTIETEQTGTVTVPARKLMDICRLIPEGCDLSVELKEDKLYIRSGRSRFFLSTLPTEQYPEFSTHTPHVEFSMDAEKLKRALDKTLFCMAHQDVREFLNGLFLDIDNSTLNAVAADGHRLAIYNETLLQPIATRQRIIVPRKGAIELHRVLDETQQSVTVQIASNSIRMLSQDATFSTKLMFGQYPDYRRMLPGDLTQIIRAEKQGLREALRRVSILSNETYKGILMEFSPGLLKISGHNPHNEEAEEELEIIYDGTPLSIGFNVTYLLDAVSRIDSDELTLSFSDTDERRRCLLEDHDDEKLKFVVMPMKP